MRIAVGLSGGVDSSVAAALLVKQGHDVIGVTMKHTAKGKEQPEKRSSCFGGNEEEEIQAAREVSENLGIPFYVVDLSKEFEEIVLDYFRNEYLSGRTPNPCIRCNSQIKFQLLINKSKILQDFNYFATGHYARVVFDKSSGRYLLKKADYIKKDQSYFLSQLTQSQLSHVIFPLGSLTKIQVREIASEFGLGTSEKEESQDFYSGDYKDLFETQPPSGQIVDGEGKPLGHHTGIIGYTIGQRKRLGISADEPLYVTEINAEKNQIIAGPKKELYKTSLIAKDINWIKYRHPDLPRTFTTKIRYGSPGEIAEIDSICNSEYRVTFYNPQKAVAPGQGIVFYEGDSVAGGGFIKSAFNLS